MSRSWPQSKREQRTAMAKTLSSMEVVGATTGGAKIKERKMMLRFKGAACPTCNKPSGDNTG